MLPTPLQQLIDEFRRLPGIGPRQAARFAFHLLRDTDGLKCLTRNLASVHRDVALCNECFLPASVRPSLASSELRKDAAHEDTEDRPRCSVCLNDQRDRSLLCVVEKEADALNLEKARQYRGIYFVLGGFIDPLEKNSLPYQRLAALRERVRSNSTKLELILALSPRREGDFTSRYIEEDLRTLASEGCRFSVTRLGRGLSSGAELEYADEETLRNALEGRR